MHSISFSIDSTDYRVHFPSVGNSEMENETSSFEFLEYAFIILTNWSEEDSSINDSFDSSSSLVHSTADGLATSLLLKQSSVRVMDVFLQLLLSVCLTGLYPPGPIPL